MAKKYFKNYKRVASVLARCDVPDNVSKKRPRGLVGKLLLGLIRKAEAERKRQRYLRKLDGSEPKKVITISLDNPANPYYHEGKVAAARAEMISSAPRTRGALGGVHIMKPINNIAAGVFKKGRKCMCPSLLFIINYDIKCRMGEELNAEE